MSVTVEFAGGLDLLFDRVPKCSVQFSADSDIRWLIRWLHDNMLKERPELFMMEDTVFVQHALAFPLIPLKPSRYPRADQRRRLGTGRRTELQASKWRHHLLHFNPARWLKSQTHT